MDSCCWPSCLPYSGPRSVAGQGCVMALHLTLLSVSLNRCRVGRTSGQCARHIWAQKLGMETLGNCIVTGGHVP